MDKTTKLALIRDFNELLKETDYKIIKCYEVFLYNQLTNSNLELPYDAEQLIEQRNNWRDQINQLQAEVELM